MVNINWFIELPGENLPEYGTIEIKIEQHEKNSD